MRHKAAAPGFGLKLPAFSFLYIVVPLSISAYILVLSTIISILFEVYLIPFINYHTPPLSLSLVESHQTWKVPAMPAPTWEVQKQARPKRMAAFFSCQPIPSRRPSIKHHRMPLRNSGRNSTPRLQGKVSRNKSTELRHLLIDIPLPAFTILPKNIHAKKAGENAPKGTVEGENAVASYEEAAKICKEKVAKIVKECRRVNQKYRDTHFDIEFDLKWGVRDCLSMLSGETEESWWENFSPGSVKRVTDIFENPQFFVGGATANDIRQGRDGDCWFMAALCTLGNKEGLIEKICVARDEQIGVYGFVFHRDGEWRSEVIDDKLYLTKPDYDASWIERNLIEDRQRVNSEEDYRKIYQVRSILKVFSLGH